MHMAEGGYDGHERHVSYKQMTLQTTTDEQTRETAEYRDREESMK